MESAIYESGLIRHGYHAVVPFGGPLIPDDATENLVHARLIALDDGCLHWFSSVTPRGGTESDIVLLDVGHFMSAIEVKGWTPESFLNHQITGDFVIYADGNRAKAPWHQSHDAAKQIAGKLKTASNGWPYLLSIVALPRLGRDEWRKRFPTGALAERADDSILFADDFVSLDAMRRQIALIAEASIPNYARRHGSEVQADHPAQFCRILFGRDLSAGAPVTTTEPSLTPPEQPLTSTVEVETGLTVFGETLQDDREAASCEVLRFLDNEAGWMKLDTRSLEQLLTRHDEGEPLRVAVVGEFNAGKSTLINALIGKEVCFTNVFEATSLAATYRTGQPEQAVLSDGGRTVATLSIPAFLEACRTRQLLGATEASVTVDVPLPYVLVDSPGLGAGTAVVDARAYDEIREADVLVWAVSASDAGSAREGAFLRRAGELKIPILCLLTKADTLDADEAAEVCDYLAEETGLSRSLILPISAKSRDAGYLEFLERLDQLVSDQDAVGGQARDARLNQAVEVATVLNSAAIRENASFLRALEIERDHLHRATGIVRRASSEKWESGLRSAIERTVTNFRIEPSETEAQVERRLKMLMNQAVQAEAMAYARSIPDLLNREWGQAFEAQANAFRRQIESLADTSDVAANVSLLNREAESYDVRARVAEDASKRSSDDARQGTIAIAGGIALAMVTSLVLPALAGLFAGIFLIGRSFGHKTLRPDVDPNRPFSPAQIKDLVKTFETQLAATSEKIDDVVGETIDRTAMIALHEIMSARGGPSAETILRTERFTTKMADRLENARVAP